MPTADVKAQMARLTLQPLWKKDFCLISSWGQVWPNDFRWDVLLLFVLISVNCCDSEIWNQPRGRKNITRRLLTQCRGAQRQRTRRPEARTCAHVRERTASVLYAAASQSDLPGRQMIWRPGVLRFYNLWMPPILVLQRTEDKALPY